MLHIILLILKILGLLILGIFGLIIIAVAIVVFGGESETFIYFQF